MFSVRDATAADSTGINSVSRFLGYTDLSTKSSESKLGNLLASERDWVYVAEENGVIIGWLHLFLSFRLASPDFYEIGGLVVCPEHRRKGVGKALVQHAAGRHNGNVRVRCNEKRVEAHEFYRALGFEDVKVQRIFEIRT